MRAAMRGTCERFAEAMAAAAVEQGLSPLKAMIVAYDASFGEVSFRDCRSVAESLTYPDGRHPHRESVRRARHQMAQAGFYDLKRILPGQTPDKARFPSSHGTLQARLIPRAFGVRRLPKRERSELRTRAQRVLAPAAALALMMTSAAQSSAAPAAMTAGPRHSAPPAVHQFERAPERAGRAPGAPLSARELEARKLRAKADLAELEARWAREPQAGPDPPE